MKYKCFDECGYETNWHLLWRLHYKKCNLCQKGFCSAVMNLDDEGHFVMCERHDGHKGLHRGLFYEWNEMNVKAPKEVQELGHALMKARIKEIHEKIDCKQKIDRYVKTGEVWKE